MVKDLSRLVLRQYNNDNNKRYFCQYCLHGCTNEKVLKNHMERCKLHEAQRIKLPEAGDKKGLGKVKFTKTEYHNSSSAIIIKILHHSILTSRNLWKLHLRQM